MKAQQIIEWGEPLQEREYDTPEPQGGEVLIRITSCGVCHSDLHLHEGGFNMGNGNFARLADMGVGLPMTMGHEIGGVVEAVGPDVEGVEIGKSYVVYPWIGCGECEHCAEGMDINCLTTRPLGTRRDGGYATHVICPDKRYLFEHGDVGIDLACTYACSGLTAYSALKKHEHLTEKDHVVIVGAGGVGLSAVMLAKHVTKAKIIVADTDPEKRSVARQAGAHDTIDNGQPGAADKLKEMCGGGVRGVIDFVGRPETAAFGLDCLAKSGKLVLVGLYGEALPLALPRMPIFQLSIQGSYVGSLQDMQELMELVVAGKVPPIPVTTRPLDEANDALQALVDGAVSGRQVLKP
ncbi:MAG: alcohol dehydrogenase [Minwuia sp.]|uniref:alcohol dehydrogenase n=1 Tax=Minwuia sp. TaxID=2493630 RepID=UPI003A88C1A0